MIFRQITHDDLGCASYLVGDDDAGGRRGRRSAPGHRRVPAPGALPGRAHRARPRDPQPRRPRLRPRAPGRRRPARPSTSTARAAPEYDHEPFDDGWELALGRLVRARPAHPRPPARAHRLRARSTPSAAPSRGRCSPATRCSSAASRAPTSPSSNARGRARHLPLAPRPPAARCPTRARCGPATSAARCAAGPGIDLKVSSTIGYERAHQELLAIDDEDEFVERAVAGLGPQPPNFQRHRRHQHAGRWRRGVAHVDPLTPRQVEQHQRDGALVVDVRTELQFDDAHIPGAVCITALRAGFGSKLAWLADHDQPVVVVGRDDDDAPRRDRAGGLRRGHQRRRLPGRRDDELARGPAARSRASRA